MAIEVPKKKVVPVTLAKPFLEEKLRQIELDLASLRDSIETSEEESFKNRSAILLKHQEDYIQIHQLI